MISFVKGTVSEVEPDAVVIETASGLGFHVYMPASSLDALPTVGSKIRLYTHMQVREDGVSLFGFCSREDLQMFRLLIGVNGVGPKAALGLLSVISADDLRFAVLAEDTKAIAKAPGVGVKTARKIILELKDRLNLEEALEWKQAHLEAQAAVPDRDSHEGAASEAVMALTALGYSNTEALRAVRRVEGADAMEVEAILKTALKYIGN